MLDSIPTAKELQAELKAALNKWKDENPAPRIDIEEEPELPEPTIIRTDKALLIIEALSGDKAQLHMLEGNATRKIELDHKQVTKLIQTLVELRRPMKAHRAWKTIYEEQRNRFDYELGAWNRQFMAFRDSVRRRMGLFRNEAED